MWTPPGYTELTQSVYISVIILRILLCTYLKPSWCIYRGHGSLKYCIVLAGLSGTAVKLSPAFPCCKTIVCIALAWVDFRIYRYLIIAYFHSFRPSWKNQEGLRKIFKLQYTHVKSPNHKVTAPRGFKILHSRPRAIFYTEWFYTRTKNNIHTDIGGLIFFWGGGSK